MITKMAIKLGDINYVTFVNGFNDLIIIDFLLNLLFVVIICSSF